MLLLHKTKKFYTLEKFGGDPFDLLPKIETEKTNFVIGQTVNLPCYFPFQGMRWLPFKITDIDYSKPDPEVTLSHYREYDKKQFEGLKRTLSHLKENHCETSELDVPVLYGKL